MNQLSRKQDPMVSSPELRLGDLVVDGTRTVIMGVLNVTPDSFSDGGEFFDVGAALLHGERMAWEGADLLDVGGESTRPGAAPVTAREELERLLPVLQGLRERLDLPLSVDTYKAEVAASACRAGATLVNDVSGLTLDPELAFAVAEAGASMVLGHIRGTPRTMQNDVRYQDVLAEVGDALQESMAKALAAGVGLNRILVDPGIGFGKSLAGNMTLLMGVGQIRERLGRPVLVGASRKSFLGALTGAGAQERLPGTLAAHVLARAAGADMIRVHDVAAARQAALVADAILDVARRT